MVRPVTDGQAKNFSPHIALFGVTNHSTQARCGVIVAHPNDEIVGAGSLISHLNNVRVLHVTSGTQDHSTISSQSGAERFVIPDRPNRECLAALQLAHVFSGRVFDLGLPQFKPSFQLIDLSWMLLAFLQKACLQIVITHAYEGGHPDHDATAFATHAAVRLLGQNGLKPPAIFEMALHPSPDGPSKVPEFLHRPARESTTLMLDQKARFLKRRMFRCFRTQREVFEGSPLDAERFRQAPTYDFKQPPHDGKLHYESFDWGINGKQWRNLAAEAWDSMFLTHASTNTQKLTSAYAAKNRLLHYPSKPGLRRFG